MKLSLHLVGARVSYLVMSLMLVTGSAWSGPIRPPIAPIQPYPFAATIDYPKIPGLCIVPAWEYGRVDTNQDGVVDPGELERYCRKVDRQRTARSLFP